tara:strand:+ start:357 stop:1001 length:645 start_codon:yes stop_codon:yes gene_type:complete
MNNLLNRIFTSMILFFIVYGAMINRHLLLMFISLIGFVVMIEVYRLIKVIFKGNNNKILFFYLIPVIYLSIFFPQLYFFITSDNNNKLIFIYLLLVCVMTDLGGYIFGKFFQGKKLTNISPNKTYSGLIGSYILSNIVFIYFFFKFNFSYSFLIFTFIICSISQVGDLFISYLKRKAKVKDTGTLLPGHGGILDRIDGIIFALPIGINLIFLFK